MLLVTTALTETWRTDQETLFLGEWCRRYDLQKIWQNIPHEVATYHWDDREKLHQDCSKLEQLYEELLPEVADRLNLIHGTHFGVRYWRILIGPWLAYFTQAIFDRWSMVRIAEESECATSSICLDLPWETAIPQNMEQFIAFMASDIWNHQILSRFIRGCTSIKILRIPDARLPQTSSSVLRPVINLGKRCGSRLINALSGMAVRDHELFFIGTGLSIMENLKLQATFGQIPKLWRPVQAPYAIPDQRKRDWHLDGACSHSTPFEVIVRALIPEQIPALYLEGYNALRRTAAKMPWPKSPKLIWTSASWNSDEVFKAWAAEKTEEGVPLAIGQHGGTYGSSRYFFNETHEVAVSDIFLSWGWKKPETTVRPVGNWRVNGSNLAWNPEGHALMVEVSLPRYSYHLHSVPVAGQWLEYFDQQCEFVEALSRPLQQHVLVRLYGHDFGWFQKERWKNRLPHIALNDGKAALRQLMRRARVVISTYNATAHLDSMAMNVPTIIFWNPRHWELRTEAIHYFEKLAAAGIFHSTPYSAATHLSSIWNDISGWWHSQKVQRAREAFCEEFSNHPSDMTSRLRKNLSDIPGRAAKGDDVPRKIGIGK